MATAAASLDEARQHFKTYKVMLLMQGQNRETLALFDKKYYAMANLLQQSFALLKTNDYAAYANVDLQPAQDEPEVAYKQWRALNTQLLAKSYVTFDNAFYRMIVTISVIAAVEATRAGEQGRGFAVVAGFNTGAERPSLSPGRPSSPDVSAATPQP